MTGTDRAWIDAMVQRLSSAVFVEAAGTYWVSVDMAIVMAAARIHHREAAPFANELLRAIRQAVGSRATILVSAFNFDFPRTKSFDVVNDRIQTGAFGSLLLRSHARNRTPQPFYSFLVFGAGENELLDHPSPNCTGAQSIFEWVVAHRVDLVTIGHHYVKSLTSVHHAEEIAAVPYRYRKTFSGDVIRQGRTQAANVTFFARKLDVCDFSALTLAGDDRFRRLGLLRTLPLGTRQRPLLAHVINLTDTHREMVEDLRAGPGGLVDYLGPQRANSGVITAAVANKLFLEDLASLRIDGGLET